MNGERLMQGTGQLTDFARGSWCLRYSVWNMVPLPILPPPLTFPVACWEDGVSGLSQAPVSSKPGHSAL